MCGTEGCSSLSWTLPSSPSVTLKRVCVGRHCAHTFDCAPYGWANNA